MRKKVLMFSLDKRDTTAFWRSQGLKHLNSKEFEVHDISGTQVFDWTTFAGFSVFFMQRPFAREHTMIINAAKSMGLKVILDYDDDLSCVPELNPTFEMYLENVGNFYTCLKMADEIWVTTESIKETISKHNKNVVIIPNALNDYLFPVAKKRLFNMKTKKGHFRGGGSHSDDLEEYDEYLIKTINDNLDWEFSFTSDKVMLTKFKKRTGDNCFIRSPRTIMEFFRFLNDENPNFMFFPLTDYKFNKGKSNISFLEGTYAGGAFFGMTEFEQFSKPGMMPLLSMNETLKMANSDMNILKEAHDESWQYVQDELLLSKINKIREQRILANL